MVIAGAGASFGAGLPLAIRLRDVVLNRLSADQTAGIGPRLAAVLKGTQELLQTEKPTHPLHEDPSLETLIDRLLGLRFVPPATLGEKWRDLPAFDTATLLSFVTKHVTEVLIDPGSSEYLAHVARLLPYCEPLPIFSLNHDLCFEYAFDMAGIRYTVGFGYDGRWSPSALHSATTGILLYKLHGSVDWTRDYWDAFPFRRASKDKILELLQEPAYSMTYEYLDGYSEAEFATPVIHFGGREKFILEYPFLDFLYELQHRLLRASVVVLVGYGLMDRHVNHLLLQSLRVRKQVVVEVNPKPFLPNADRDWIVALMSQLGSRLSQYESSMVQQDIGHNLQYIPICTSAEDEGTWKKVEREIARAVKAG